MARAVQKRRLETRANLLAAAHDVIAVDGYGALRVEDVVSRAGVAKGTFFSHFKDKDALMDLLIGAELDRILDRMQAEKAPLNADDVTNALMPLLNFMTTERYVLDVILRYSGAAAISAIGPIAMTFGRQIEIYTGWFESSQTQFRRDINAELLAEGLQAFALQAVAVHFCALHNSVSVRDRLSVYLEAWLHPRAATT